MGLGDEIVMCVFCEKAKPYKDIARSFMVKGKTQHMCKSCKAIYEAIPKEEHDFHDDLAKYEKLGLI